MIEEKGQKVRDRLNHQEQYLHAGGQAFVAISPEAPSTVTSNIWLDGVTQDPSTSGVLHVEELSSYASAVKCDGTTV